MRIVLLLLFLFIPFNSLFAHGEHHHNHNKKHKHHHSHGAHEHGVANLNVVVDKSELVIEFKSPAYDIIGFEHNPRNSEQLEKAKSQIQILQNVEKVFSIPDNAKCEIRDVVLDTDLNLDSLEQGENSSSSHHSDLRFLYTFFCEKIGLLNEIKVLFFELYPSLERIDTQVVSDRGQFSVRLNKVNNRISMFNE